MQKLGNTLGGTWQGGGNFLAKRGNNMVESASKEYGLANAQKNNLITEGMNKNQVGGAINKGRVQFRNELYKDYGGRSGFRTQQNNINYKNMYDSQKPVKSPVSTVNNPVSTVDELEAAI